MLTVEKKNIILKLIDEHSVVSVSNLTELLNVSEVTVRKMLNNLARQGALRRTRGGAVSLSVAVRESDLRTKERTNVNKKKAIARKAFELIEDNETIFLDAGSTTLELGKKIRNGDKRNITVVTNALNIALELLDSYDIEVIVIGGHLRHGVVSCVGPLAEQAIASLYFDKAFIGANNVSLRHGATTPKLAEGQFKHDATKAAGKKFLLCGSSKFGSASMAKICPIEDFDAVITDSDLPAKMRNELGKAGVNLILTGPQEKQETSQFSDE